VTISKDSPSYSFTLANHGILPIHWKSTVATGFTLSPSTTTLSANTSVTLTLSASSLSVFQQTSQLWLLQLTPSGTSTYDSCFESVSMLVTVAPAIDEVPTIEYQLSGSLAVLGFVIAIIGSWITVTLVEQMHSRIRENKHHIIWLLSCPLAFTLCAIWPCILITMSAMQVVTSPRHTTSLYII
jgi:NO-binding membrane sensor protein with MHYT domain